MYLNLGCGVWGVGWVPPPVYCLPPLPCSSWNRESRPSVLKPGCGSQSPGLLSPTPSELVAVQ